LGQLTSCLAFSENDKIALCMQKDKALFYFSNSSLSTTQALTRRMEKWREAFLPIHEQWIEKHEKKGKAARKVYEEATRLIKQYVK